MTAEQFLLCLRKFVATSGKPRQIISDNQSSKVDCWGSRELSTTSLDTQSYLANESIKRSFIIELTPLDGFILWKTYGTCKSVSLKEYWKDLYGWTANCCKRRGSSCQFPAFGLCRSWLLQEISLNPKTGVSSLAEEDRLQDSDFLSELSPSQKLLDMWRKGQKHLDMFSKLWFEGYVLSLRERTEKQ